MSYENSQKCRTNYPDVVPKPRDYPYDLEQALQIAASAGGTEEFSLARIKQGLLDGQLLAKYKYLYEVFSGDIYLPFVVGENHVSPDCLRKAAVYRSSLTGKTYLALPNKDPAYLVFHKNIEMHLHPEPHQDDIPRNREFAIALIDSILSVEPKDKKYSAVDVLAEMRERLKAASSIGWNGKNLLIEDYLKEVVCDVDNPKKGVLTFISGESWSYDTLKKRVSEARKKKK